MELRIKDVSFSYDSIPVLDSVRFTVDSREFVGIIGPNGSGKTTLLRTISRVLKPVLGAVMVDSKSVHSMRPVDVAKKVAVVPQDSHVSFNFTSLDVVMMGRTPHLKPFEMETSEDLRIAKEAMSATRCLHLSNRKVNELSGGERRRVLIAKALTQEPQVLLLDEPTLNLDVSNQIELMGVIGRLCKEKGLVVLSVFHDFNLAARYSDKILLLHEGKVFSYGNPENVLTRENLLRVFGVNTEVSTHPIAGLNVTILSTASKDGD